MPLKIDTSKMSEEEKIEMERLQQKRAKKLAKLNIGKGIDQQDHMMAFRDVLLKGVLITLDCTEAVIDEAIQEGCNLIISHHPILFSGIKRLNESTSTKEVYLTDILI